MVLAANAVSVALGTKQRSRLAAHAALPPRHRRQVLLRVRRKFISRLRAALPRQQRNGSVQLQRRSVVRKHGWAGGGRGAVAVTTPQLRGEAQVVELRRGAGGIIRVGRRGTLLDARARPALGKAGPSVLGRVLLSLLGRRRLVAAGELEGPLEDVGVGSGKSQLLRRIQGHRPGHQGLEAFLRKLNAPISINYN